MHYLPFLLVAYGTSLLALLGMAAWSFHRLRRAERLLEEER